MTPEPIGGPAPLQVSAQWRTMTDVAYDEIRHRILGGQLPPGGKITVRILAEELGLSPTPIKNALVALEREGLLDTTAYRGFSVPKTDATVVTDAFEVLTALDILAAERTARLPDPGPVLDDLRQLVSGQDVAEPDAADRAQFEMNFHKVLWQGCGNQQLLAAAEHQRGLILVASGGLLEQSSRLHEVRDEHAEIIRAIAAGESAVVAEACRTHMQRSAETVLARLAAGDAPGTGGRQPDGGTR